MKDEEILQRLEKSRAPSFDPRWPNVNVTNRCYQEYTDYHRCVKKLGEKKMNTKICDFFAFNFKGYCPRQWIERWDGQLEEGLFPSKI